MGNLKPTGHFHSDDVRRDLLGNFIIPPYGFLSELRIRPKELLPNMDASNPYVLSVSLVDSEGTRIPITVQSICEKVTT